jgi:hypothetical protein
MLESLYICLFSRFNAWHPYATVSVEQESNYLNVVREKHGAHYVDFNLF